MVYGFGEKKTPEAFVSACDRFIYTEILGHEHADDSLADGLSTDKVTVHSKETSAAEKHSETNAEKLKNKKLIDLLQDAYEAIAEEDSWAHLEPLGSQINKLSPSFDPRNYGYKKLSDLVKEINLFEIKKTDKTVQIKSKR